MSVNGTCTTKTLSTACGLTHIYPVLRVLSSKLLKQSSFTTGVLRNKRKNLPPFYHNFLSRAQQK